MRVSGDWLADPNTQAVCAMLTDAGYSALFVGGCVRNALIGAPVNDIDIATDALPDTVVRLANSCGFQAIPTGMDHGTITVVSGHIPHEITTYRRDIETDGRHAVVAFSKHVEDDAHRRDFTMNALYAQPDGLVVDPLGGMRDLVARRVRFIDDADARIREDYLRILRYFRFHAWYGDEDAGMDAGALAAIAANVSGIETLSNERIGAEFLKLLAAPNPAPSVAAMRSAGVLGAVLSGADDRSLAVLIHLESTVGAPPDPIRRLAILGGNGVSGALRLSKKQLRTLDTLRREAGSSVSVEALGYRFGIETGLSILLLRGAIFETPMQKGDIDLLTKGSLAEFPVAAGDLMPEFQGPALGAELKRLESIWINSGFSLEKEALLKREQ